MGVAQQLWAYPAGDAGGHGYATEGAVSVCGVPRLAGGRGEQWMELRPAEWMLLLASSGFEALLVGLLEPMLAAVDELGIGAGTQLQAP